MGSLSYGSLGLACEADILTVALDGTVLGSAPLADLALLPSDVRCGVIGGVTLALTQQEIATLRDEVAVLVEPPAEVPTEAPAAPAPTSRKTRRSAT